MGTSGEPMMGALGVLGLLHGLVLGLVDYIFLGWLQQTLLMLVGIKSTGVADVDVLSRL